MGLFDDEYKRMLAQLAGRGAIAQYLEQQEATRKMMEMSVSSLATSILYKQRQIADVLGQATALGFAYKTEVERAYEKLIQPWGSASEFQRTIAAATRQDELRQAVATATGSLVDLYNKQRDAIQSALNFRAPFVFSELDRLRETLARPEWKAIIGELAESQLEFGELVEEAAQIVQERGLVETPEPSAEGKPWYRSRDTLIGVVGLLLAVLFWLRSEMVAASSEQQVAELGVQMHEAFKAQAIVITELRRDLRRDEQRIWQVRERGAVLRIDPKAGSRKLRDLHPGEKAVEIDDTGKWLLIEVKVEDRVIAGWVLKKRLCRLPKGPDAAAN